MNELNRLIRDGGSPDFLCVTEADLTGEQVLSFDGDAFPDAVPIGGQPVALTYAYSPGEERDGVTVKLGFGLAQTVSQACVEWSVPGLREGLVNELLRALPKAIRRELQPFPLKIQEIVSKLEATGESLQADLARFIRQRYGVAIPLDAWPTGAIPAHLRPRIEVLGNDQKILGTSRDLGVLRQKLEQVQAKPAPDDSAWSHAAKQWERAEITTWNFGTLPARITVSEAGPVPTYAWPGLPVENEDVSLRLFRTEELARLATLGGIQKLVERALAKDFAWLHRDLRELKQFDALAANFCPLAELQATAFENLKRHVLPGEVFSTLNEENFLAAVQQTRLLIPGLALKLVDQVGVILRTRNEILSRGGIQPLSSNAKTLSDLSQLNLAPCATAKPTEIWVEELDALLPRNFLAVIPWARLAHVPRYLKALVTRRERAKLNPLKDKERSQIIAPYLAKLKSLQDNPPKFNEAMVRVEEFRWLVEEYKVSLFAQELGTAVPVSPKRLDQLLQTSGLMKALITSS